MTLRKAAVFAAVLCIIAVSSLGPFCQATPLQSRYWSDGFMQDKVELKGSIEDAAAHITSELKALIQQTGGKVKRL